MTADPQLSRREANKTRTRDALVDAVYALLSAEGVESLTAERVADAAGISRRTFFNYFSSVEEVVAYRAQQVYEELQVRLMARPAEESLIDSANAVVTEIFTVEQLATAVQSWRACDRSAAAGRFAMEAHTQALIELTQDWVRVRLAASGTTPRGLRISVLIAAAMAAFDAARRHWLASHAGPIDRDALDRFLACIHEAFETLRPSVEAPSS